VSDLRSKLNARAEKATAHTANAEEAASKYKEIALREYPRLVNELFQRTKAHLDGVKGLTLSSQEISETLTYQQGSTDTGFHQVTVGTVRVPVWGVSFFNRTIQFRPKGIGYFGVEGKIEVLTRGPNPYDKNPFDKDAVFIVRSGEDASTWKLAVLGQQSRLVELTDDLFRQKLEQVLL